jgi:8-oxo-dGTP diphosphatase
MAVDPPARDVTPSAQVATGPSATATADETSLPLVDLRVVFFTVGDGELLVACPLESNGPVLPRGRPIPSESLDVSARRIGRDATGVREQYLEQLYTLSVHELPDWTVIVSYMALVGPAEDSVAIAGPAWRAVDALDLLSAADRMVVDYAILRLRAKLGYTNIAFYLLPERFTFSELQETYETILARRLDKRNFRRRMIASGILVETDEKRREGSHRPASLYRFRPTDDRETYLTPPWAGGAREASAVE